MSPLLTPLKLWHVTDGKGRMRWFLWKLPILASLLYLIPLYIGYPVPLRGANGLFEVVAKLLQILIGFYIASLCAIATFQNPILDKPLYGKVELAGVELLRRRFLSLLFGYLAFLSIGLYLFGMSALWFGQSLQSILQSWGGSTPSLAFCLVKHYAGLIYTVFALQLLCMTLLGLHYLSDRIHRPD
jgi:hypothetical protein